MLSFVFLILTILTGKRCNHKVALNSTFLLAKDVDFIKNCFSTASFLSFDKSV